MLLRSSTEDNSRNLKRTTSAPDKIAGGIDHGSVSQGNIAFPAAASVAASRVRARLAHKTPAIRPSLISVGIVHAFVVFCIPICFLYVLHV
jgi:hypothetical protein